MHVNNIDWHVTPFRADKWFEIWHPALDRSARPRRTAPVT